MKLKAFTSIDLIVIVGLILVLFGFSLTVLDRLVKKTNDERKISMANEVSALMDSYRKSNFNIYPVPQTGSSSSYSSVVLSSADANFLKIALGERYIKATRDASISSGLVYVFKNDGSEATVVVSELQKLKDKCNAQTDTDVQIIREFLLKDPSACYYTSKKSSL